MEELPLYYNDMLPPTTPSQPRYTTSIRLNFICPLTTIFSTNPTNPSIHTRITSSTLSDNRTGTKEDLGGGEGGGQRRRGGGLEAAEALVVEVVGYCMQSDGCADQI